MIKPSAKILAKWRKMRDNNDTSANLANMARWVSNALFVGAATKPHDVDLAAAPYKTAHDYYVIFDGIKAIHDKIGHIPEHVRRCRYDVMCEWLEFVKAIDADVFAALNSCL